MALRSTQPLNRNEYQEYFLGGKGGRCVGLTTLPPSYEDCLEIWESQPPGTLRACPGVALPLPFIIYSECLSVALVIQHAMRKSHFVICCLAGFKYFSTFPYEGTIF